MKQAAITAVLAVALSGCATKKFEVEKTFDYSDGHQSQKTETLTGVATFFDDADDGSWMTCDDNTVHQVEVETNWAYSLVNIATLGLVAPYKVTYKCGLPEQACEVVLGQAEPDCSSN